MELMKLRNTGIEYFTAKKRDVQSAMRDRRNTRLRDLIVQRLLKRINHPLKHNAALDNSNNLQANRIHEINNLRKEAN